MIMIGLRHFVAESNRIEGIHREPKPSEYRAHEAILERSDIVSSDLMDFVAAVQPNAVLRSQRGLNVRVGNHVAPPGGPEIPVVLGELLFLANQEANWHLAYGIHRDYEALHPFTDGNGRSGRVLWLWMMKQRGELDRALSIGFLHCWYYQSLEFYRLSEHGGGG